METLVQLMSMSGWANPNLRSVRKANDEPDGSAVGGDCT